MNTSDTSYRIMIVDDEAILRTGVYHLCNWKDYGIEVVGGASNGEEALQLIPQLQPHVVFTDVVMPVMDGVEFAKVMQKQYPHIKVIVLSSYSEFEYVRETFKYGVTDYLLKPKVSAPELVNLIHTLCADIPSQSPAGLNQKEESDNGILITRLLSNFGDEQNDLMSKLSTQLPLSHYRMLKCSATLQLSKTELTQAEIERLLISIAENHLSSFTYACFFQKEECSLLINYDQDDEEQVFPAIDQLARDVKTTLSDLTFVLSNSFSSLSDLQATNDRMIQALGKMIYFHHKYWIPETEIQWDPVKVSLDSGAFTAAITNNDYSQACSLLKAFFCQVKQHQAYDDYSLKRLSQNLIYTIINTIEQLQFNSTQLNLSKIRLFKSIDLAPDLDELEHILIELLQEIESKMSEQGERRNKVVLQRIYHYVDQNYDQDISLSELAQQLHLNYSYLSSYFKQQTNENLTAYINKVRVEKAKQLLMNWNLSISEISRMTGFSEHNYFSKVFKKLTGQTPAEYRNHI